MTKNWFCINSCKKIFFRQKKFVASDKAKAQQIHDLAIISFLLLLHPFQRFGRKISTSRSLFCVFLVTGSMQNRILYRKWQTRRAPEQTNTIKSMAPSWQFDFCYFVESKKFLEVRRTERHTSKRRLGRDAHRATRKGIFYLCVSVCLVADYPAVGDR